MLTDKLAFFDNARNDLSLVITGGPRLPADFIKAQALGADAIAAPNSGLQAMRTH